MDYSAMTREELVKRLGELDSFMSDVVVFWGSKNGLRQTFEAVAENASEEYTDAEVENAKLLTEMPGAFNEFIQLVRDSFERGGINYAISEKISELMDEAAKRVTNK